jgi:hypothetical protein
MGRIVSIIDKNSKTFYNYRTKDRTRVWPRVIFFALISPCLAFLLTNNLTNFINSINTVASILLGFGFSVLFYIASGNAEPDHSDMSLERKNRLARLETLSIELFHNVSYFVMTASAALAFSMIAIAPEAQDGWFTKTVLPLTDPYRELALCVVWWLGFAIRAVFFFLLIEAGYTFGRIVGRVNFLFEEKLKLRGGKLPS